MRQRAITPMSSKAKKLGKLRRQIKKEHGARVKLRKIKYIYGETRN